MKIRIEFRRLLIVLVSFVIISGCGGGGDDATPPPSEPPVSNNVPPIPVPSSVGESLPGVSKSHIVGLSDEVADFEPMVSGIIQMIDNGSYQYFSVNRRMKLACPDLLPENTSDPAVVDERTYISARPYLLHDRYWRKIKQATLDPGDTEYAYEEAITYGTSTTHEESREFSRTLGVEVTAGGSWGGFSAEVSAYYEQTETSSELNSVTFNEESTFTETFSVQSDPQQVTVWALWQLVDRFSMVDQDLVPIHQSDTLTYAEIPEIKSIEFPNKNTIYLSITHFNP